MRHPDGYSAETLCADLHGDGGSPGSVRVEVSRLRKLLGPWIDTERYRLTCDVDTDVRRVEGLLARRPRARRRRGYPGPLLPELRGARRRRRARAARPLAAPGGDDLGRPRGAVGVGQTPAGDDDLGAWKRLLSGLAFHDPRRARCAARVGELRRRELLQRTCNAPVVHACLVHHRGLSTARSALDVTWMLARTPDGVRADEVAGALGKSVSTAYNVLASLCDEDVAVRLPGGIYQLAPDFKRRRRERGRRRSDLHRIVETSRAHQNALRRRRPQRRPADRARARHAGQAEAAGHGPRDPRQRARAGDRQGRARVLAAAEAVDRYIANGLRPFTPTRSPARRAARRAP